LPVESGQDALKRQMDYHLHMMRMRSAMFQSDTGGGPGAPAWGVNTEAARAGLGKIGSNVMGLFDSFWQRARAGLAGMAGGPGMPREISQADWAASLARRFGGPGAVPALASLSPGVSEAAGNFSAAALDRMGIGSTADRTAKAAEETARNTRDIKARLEDSGFEE
jgi:hypothetical protein